MIWNEELAASLDQAGGCIAFHRTEVTRQQQLALIIAEKVNSMAEQNEKALDAKMGTSGGWGDRADGKTGEKRGEQVQERRGRGDRTRGGSRGNFLSDVINMFLTICVPQVVAEVVELDLHKGLEIRWDIPLSAQVSYVCVYMYHASFIAYVLFLSNFQAYII